MTDSARIGHVVSVSIREMTSEEQLAEIERKLEAWGKSTDIYFPPPNHLGLRESRWLLARVCELEGQVAADAEVREAAVEWGAAYDKMTDLSHNPNYNLDDMTRSVRAVNEMGRRLLAALAARKEEA